MSNTPLPDDEQVELLRLLEKARPIKDEAGDLRKVQEAIEAEQHQDPDDSLGVAQLAFVKWRVLHKYIHARPFVLPEGLSRADEWREVAVKMSPVEELEIKDWVALQIEVAENRELGISDLRIRRDGPCYLILLEYVANKKRTALAVLHWAREQANSVAINKADS